MEKSRRSLYIMLLLCGMLTAGAQTPAPVSETTLPEHTGEWLRITDYKENIDKAVNGDPEAQRIVGRCYMSGIGVATDYREGWKWLARAAGSGDMEAQYQLGVTYRDGVGVRKNATEAAYWFRRAARNGHTLALLNMGKAFDNGEGVLADKRVAAENYWRAAERGNAEGAYRYAVMVRDGTGVEKNLQRALKYFLQAAGAGYPDADVQAGALERQGVKLPAKPGVKRTGASRSSDRRVSSTQKGKKHPSAKSRGTHRKSKKR